MVRTTHDFTALATTNADDDHIPQADQTVTRHVSREVIRRQGNMAILSFANSDPINLSLAPDGSIVATISNGIRSKVVPTDVLARSGILHIVDNYLLPPTRTPP